MSSYKYLSNSPGPEINDEDRTSVESSSMEDFTFRDISPDFETTSKGGGDTVVPVQYSQSINVHRQEESEQEESPEDNVVDIPLSNTSSHVTPVPITGEDCYNSHSDTDTNRAASDIGGGNTYNPSGCGDGGVMPVDHLPLLNMGNNIINSEAVDKKDQNAPGSRKSASLHGGDQTDCQSESEHNYSYADDFTDIMSDIDDCRPAEPQPQHRARNKLYSNKSDSRRMHAKPSTKPPTSSKKPLHHQHHRVAKESKDKSSGHKIEYSSIPRSRTGSTHSSHMNQPVVIKQRTNVKIMTEESYLLMQKGTKPLSVPSQIKAEALWHEGTLRVILRGPPNRLPPLKNIDYRTAVSPTMPVDVELTFIPQHTRAPFKPKAPSKPSTSTAINNYRARKPAFAFNRAQQHGLPVPSGMKEVDRNIIQNRAIGVGFITKMTQVKDPRTPVNHMISLPHVQHQGTGHMISSAFPYSSGGVSARSHQSIARTTSKHKAEGL